MNCAKLIDFCKALPNAEVERKWTNALTFMVARKMFALFIVDEKGKASELWCKVDDDAFLSRTGQPGIRPAPYLARAKWIAMEPQAMSDAEAKETLRRARELVFMKLPKRLQKELQAQSQ